MVSYAANLPDVVMCYEKQEYCNPSFEASELSDAMLDCYCPNNRKGFYTKKVTRSVEYSRYCGDDSVEDAEIQLASANRMFHMCENWCLFSATAPMSKSWYWNPWNTCFREQWAGAGEIHSTYCFKVIRDPYTVEMQYINYRAQMMCNVDELAAPPTESPITNPPAGAAWYVGAEYQSCTDVCAAESKECAENWTNAMRGADDGSYVSNFAEAGFTCDEVVEGAYGWALPGVKINNGTCLSRNDDMVS